MSGKPEAKWLDEKLAKKEAFTIVREPPEFITYNLDFDGDYFEVYVYPDGDVIVGGDYAEGEIKELITSAIEAKMREEQA